MKAIESHKSTNRETLNIVKLGTEFGVSMDYVASDGNLYEGIYTMGGFKTIEDARDFITEYIEEGRELEY